MNKRLIIINLYSDQLKILKVYGGIFLFHVCKFPVKSVDMQEKYGDMQDSYFYMQHNYADVLKTCN